MWLPTGRVRPRDFVGDIAQHAVTNFRARFTDFVGKSVNLKIPVPRRLWASVYRLQIFSKLAPNLNERDGGV